jgi:metacaspase-1
MNRALLVGINRYPSSPLNGCVNDVVDIANFLVEHRGFQKNDIRLLTDERATKTAIIERLGWLLTGIKAGDNILFHYSGHGAQVATRNPQGEVDGRDEVICPVDFDWTDEHTIRDKELNQIFKSIPEGVNFIWVSDSCCSADLSRDMLIKKSLTPPADMLWRIETAHQKKIKDTGFNKLATDLNLVLISGCESNKTSADFPFNNRYNGALTYFLLETLKQKDGLTLSLDKLVAEINAKLKKNEFVEFPQNPQLEGNSNLKKKPFF